MATTLCARHTRLPTVLSSSSNTSYDRQCTCFPGYTNRPAIDTTPPTIDPTSDRGRTSNKLFSHHQPSTTFTPHGFQLSLNVSCVPHNGLWVIFCLPLAAHYFHKSYVPAEPQRAILHSETAFAPRPDAWPAAEREVAADVDTGDQVPGDPSTR